MEEMKKTPLWKKLSVVALAVLIAFTLTKLTRLTESIDSLRSQNTNLRQEIQNLRSEINAIYDNIDRQMREEASLLSGVNFTIGEISEDMRSVALHLSVVPKVITDSTTLSVTVDGNTVPLTRSGSTYTGTVNVGLFVDYNQWPLLTVETEDSTKNQYLDTIDIAYLFSRYLPTLYADMSASSKHSDGKLLIESGFTIESKPASSSSPVTFVSFTLVEEVNGKEVGRKDITADVRKAGESYNTRYTETFEMAHSDELRIYVIAEDSLGYIHKTLVHYRVANSDGSVAEAVFGGESIYDQNGNLLYGEKQLWE